uniref:Helitron helicase-like domain-containing protein n=1 Tax=Brassica oleracea var. oleracea TaxID=109376 RepID=A0A0D3C319_BRAOL
MKRKQGFPPIQRGDSTQQTERITRRKQNSGNLVQVKRSQNQKSIRTLDVPVSTVFKRLFHGVGYIHTDAVSPNVNQGKQLTPCTPRNIIKCATSMDCGTGQASYGTLQRSCLTSVAYKAGIRKRLRSGLQDKTNICSFMDRLDETSGDESEEDGNAVAYDSDFEDRFDGNFQENLDCSSQENTDEESDPEIEVVDLTVTKEPNSIPARNRVKSLASLFEEAFRATEKPSKKTKPKEDAYIDEGDATFTCTYCGAIMWFGERLNRRLKTRNPNEHFQRNTRAYNMVFSFTSLGGKVDRAVRKGKGPNMLVLQGENYHLIGSLQPPTGNDAKFGQLYIVDTENETENRTNALSKGGQKKAYKKRDGLKKEIIDLLIKMLNETNPYVKQFRSAKDRFTINPKDSFHMRIVSDRAKDGRTYDTPTTSEVAALIPGDFNLDMDKRDIVLQQKSGKLLRIDEIHASYLALQYPLLFVHGEDGFRLGIKKGVTKATEKQKKENISIRQFFAFRLHERKNEAHTILNSGRLFQQFVVDAYTTIESNRLRYLKTHQTSLRYDSYDSIKESENAGRIDMAEQGSSFLLPATFTGGPRYMKNLYLDAMTICKHFGFSDLFITFTCNPKWPEITRHLKKRNLKAEDRSDIICRMFKIKLDSLMDDLNKKNILGKIVSCELNIQLS